MRYVYPVKLECDEDGRFVALARDVPEAMAYGESVEAACAEMMDALGAALAKLLGVSEGAVRRLVDPDHASRLDRVVAALDVLGHHLIIEDQPRRVA